jgi:hypothetical protein
MIVIHDLRLIIMTKAKNILSMNKLTITEFRVGRTIMNEKVYSSKIFGKK